MKLTIVLLTAAILQVHASGVAQKVTFSGKNVSLNTIFTAIERQTGYVFFYRQELVEKTKSVSIAATDMPLAEFLHLALKNQLISYRITDKTIMLSVSNETALNPLPVVTADSSLRFDPITGVITGSDGKPLAGINVQVKGGKAGTVTDASGRFTVNAQFSDILVISSAGYETREVKVPTSGMLNITLNERVSTLDETLVIAYGTTTARYSTGNVSSVKAAEIQKQPVGNPLAAMQGRMAGVQVVPSSGLPGSSMTVTIRGRNSLNSGNLPLYIVDGVPFTFYNSNAVPVTDNLNALGTSGANGGISPFNSLNPADIESISVLKDADATAIYGARGANGVVLITTKKGKGGNAKLDVNLSSGVAKVTKFIDMLSGNDYLALRKEAFKNDNVIANTTNAPDLTTWSQTDFTNWQKELIGGTAHYTDAQASLSGGTEATHFTVAGAYHKETTVYPGEHDAKRFSGRFNVEHTSANKKFHALFSATYSSDVTNLPGSDLASGYNLAPNYPAYTATGALYFFRGITNPYAFLQQEYKGITTNLNTNASLRYEILKGLSLKLSAGYATIDLNQVKKLPASSKNNASAVQISSAIFSDNTSKSYIIEPQLEYNTSIFKGRLNVLAGTTIQQNEAKGYNNTGENYSSDALLGVLSSAGRVIASDSYDMYRYNSVFGRMTYNWSGKYIINGTIRRDGSSRFGQNNLFGTFGAVGAGYIFSEEKLVKDNLSFLSFGKLRSSYGVTGNDQILNYQYLSTYTALGTASSYQGTTIQFPARLANPNIQWERTKKLEVALELGFLTDRILLSTSFYRNISDNQLLYLSTPAQVGFPSYLGNFAATVENKGVEIELNTTNIQSGAFTWTSSFNYTQPITKLRSFNDLATNNSYKNQYIIGESPNVRRLYNYSGIDPATGKILYITQIPGSLPSFATDRVAGDAGHPFYGGLVNNFTYKQFELGFFIQFSHSNGTTNSVTNTLGSLVNQNISTLDHWRAAGDQPSFPASTANSGPVFNSYDFYYNSSTRFFGNASWLKLKNVNVAYTFTKSVASKIHLSNLKLYAQAQNLWFTAKSKYVYDPETGTSMPPLRTVVIGLNASF